MFNSMRPEIDISQFSPAECAWLAEELWERARNHPEDIPVPPSHLVEITRRIAAYESGEMGPGEAWEAVRERLWRK